MSLFPLRLWIGLGLLGTILVGCQVVETSPANSAEPGFPEDTVAINLARETALRDSVRRAIRSPTCRPA